MGFFFFFFLRFPQSFFFWFWRETRRKSVGGRRTERDSVVGVWDDKKFFGDSLFWGEIFGISRLRKQTLHICTCRPFTLSFHLFQILFTSKPRYQNTLVFSSFFSFSLLQWHFCPPLSTSKTIIHFFVLLLFF